MATNNDRTKATGLQQAMETQLLALEKLGALPPTAADEVRNIVAESIANKFGEPYRTFLCTREGVEIRRDAVPKKCSLRESVEGFVANERSIERNTKTKDREGQKKATSAAQPTTQRDRAAFDALSQVNKPQSNLSLTVGHSARHSRADACKTSLPEKQQPKAPFNRANPTKGDASQSLHQASLESGQKAWDVLLAQKAAEAKTLARNDDQRKPTAQGTGKQSAAAHRDGTSAQKGEMTSQSLEATAETPGEANDRRTTPKKPVKTSKPTSDSSEDLIDFGF